MTTMMVAILVLSLLNLKNIHQGPNGNGNTVYQTDTITLATIVVVAENPSTPSPPVVDLSALRFTPGKNHR
jgi:hypothetical protein